MGGNNSTPSREPGKEESTRAAGHQGVNTFGKTTVDVAITGMTGAGKSSLVNALRGLSDFDEGAAQTDVVEGTMEPVGYPHPIFSDVTIWDLPGIGTRRFKAEEYLEKVNYSQYDFFIIVASSRFTDYDIQLAHAVRKMGKRFYYVRSQIDLCIAAEKLKPDFKEEATIQHVKKDCRENLVRAGFPSPEIFLLSSWCREKYDFHLLEWIFENEIKDLKKKILRPAVPPGLENNRLFMFMFSQYDFFMIVASQRFTENDVLLAREIQKMKKKFYYVRSKMDVSMAAEIRNPNYDREKSLLKIRKYCCDNLILAGESDPRVFLISTRDLSMYDFPLLQEALESDLDDLKSRALILAMPVFSRKMLEKKKAAMESFIWKLALVACVIGAVPVPSLSLVCDITILTTGLIRFYKVFGLDEESLRRVAELVGKDYEVLKSAIKKSPMFSRITPDHVVVLLTRSFLCSTLAVIEEALRIVPVLGSLVGGASSFFTIYYMLRGFLQDIVEDAESVRAKAAEL